MKHVPSPLTLRVSSLVLALAFLGMSPGAMASDPPASVNAVPDAGQSVPKLSIEQYELENGLTVILSPDASLPVVAVEVLYLVGSGHEQRGRTGFAHLFEHLMFQGSLHHNKEYFLPFEPIGARVNGTTSRDRTNYYERTPKNYLETSLWMESDRMQFLLPALDQPKLDNQRDVVKNERRQRYENMPYGMSWWYMSQALYPEGHPYHHTPIGSHEDLSAATLTDVQSFFKRYYVPKNAVVAIAGDFDSTEAKQLVRKYFSSIAPGERAASPTARTPVISGIRHWQKVDTKVKLPRLYLAWHTPALYEAGDAELDLLSNVLSSGKSSRLYKPLVYEQKVAKDVSAYQVSQKLGSYYVVQATAAPGKTIEELYQALMPALIQALTVPQHRTNWSEPRTPTRRVSFSGLSRFSHALQR